MRRNQRRTLSNFAAGAIALVVTVVVVYFGFTKAIPFKHHFTISATFPTANNLRPNSPVRIAGVAVGKVVAVQHLRAGEPGALVKMQIDDKGLPIHKDATFAIRPRIFLEGNFFVDVHPGTPSAPALGDGDKVTSTRAATPVQFDQILTSLQTDTRKNLQILLKEYGTGVSDGGSAGFNASIPYWESAYKNSAIVNEATLGLKAHDLVGLHPGRRHHGAGARQQPARAPEPDHRLQRDRAGVRGAAGQPVGHGGRAAAHAARRPSGAGRAQQRVPAAAPPDRRLPPGGAVLAARHQRQPAVRGAGAQARLPAGAARARGRPQADRPGAGRAERGERARSTSRCAPPRAARTR